MSHFAEIDANNVVLQVIVAEQEFIDTLEGNWVQTSYNTRGGKHYDPDTNEEDDGTPLRKNFAMIGGSYDATRDAFIPPQPYPSWVLDDDTCLWNPPIAYPDGNDIYYWNEADQQWDPE